MSRASVPHFENHPDPHFKREEPFRFFDLPTEVRDHILGLLLARGNVALGNARNRFSGWNHEKPMWQLLEVNSRLRAEAGAVLFSQRNNTFYFPIGSEFRENYWGNVTCLIPAFPIRKLDCAFDMRAFEDTTFSAFKAAKEIYDDPLDPGDPSFDQLSREERRDFLHDGYYRYDLLGIWDTITEAFCKLDLDLLRLDISEARCPLGCCRLAEGAVKLLDGFGDSFSRFPKRIEILGALDHEKEKLRTQIENHNPSLKDRCFFVDTPGCTCAVSCWEYSST